MAGSGFGTIFRINTWGESHGEGVGVVIDGCPSGIPLSEAVVQEYLNRRRPGQTRYSTPRRENDRVVIQSGVFEGLTTGTPISMAVYNETQRSSDYSEIAGYYRPGHADFTFDAKYGFRDYRGGGRSSGRETIGRVAAGAVACALLRELGIEVFAYTASIGPVISNPASSLRENREKSPLFMLDLDASARAEDYLLETMRQQDSAGGIIECSVTGMPAGIGEPVFDKLDACLARAVFSVGAVKGFELGSGFGAASLRGSENNDCFLGQADPVHSKGPADHNARRFSDHSKYPRPARPRDRAARRCCYRGHGRPDLSGRAACRHGFTYGKCPKLCKIPGRPGLKAWRRHILLYIVRRDKPPGWRPSPHR